ncbi:MAG: sugar-binding protein [Armatimonadota bacterium]
MMNRYLIFCTMLLIAVQPVMAELSKTPAQYLLLKPKKPIVIDGKLTEWDMARTPYTINGTDNDPLHAFRGIDQYNPLKGDADLSGRVAVAWDETALYLALQVVDDHLLGIDPQCGNDQGPAPWECDSLMISLYSYRQPMINNSPYHPYPYLSIRYAPTGPNPRGKLVGGAAGRQTRAAKYWVNTRNAKWACAETKDGYAMETAIPWKDLGFAARPGEALRMAFLLADTDPDEPLSQVGWAFAYEARDLPIFRLADRTDMLGQLTVSAEAIPTNGTWRLRAQLDALAGPARLGAVTITDAAGKTVYSRPINLQVPAGMTGSALQEFKAGALPTPGSYTAHLLAGAGAQQRVITTQPFRIVAPAAQQPVVASQQGEIRHQEPLRYAHDAFAEFRSGWNRHNFVKGKEDYVPYLRKWAEPGLKGLARHYIATKHPYGWDAALQCIALYKMTGDDEYATLGRDIMDYTLTSGEFNWFKNTAVALYRYLTWKQDPDSPLAPKDAEKRYLANLCKLAEHPANHYFGETGTHNRVWMSYALLKIARIEAEKAGKPIDPRVIAYTDLHDKLIGDVGDADDASAEYHWVFFDAAIGIYFHTGDWEAFRNIKGYKKTLDRYVEMAGPSGACPQFGNCNGWHSGYYTLGAYELMAAVTRDGRYRWTAHRIAEYYYNHLYEQANQWSFNFGYTLRAFTWAYLLADDRVPVREPNPQSRFTWRHPLSPTPETLRSQPGAWHRMMDGNSWIPDKAVLNSDNNPQSMWALVDLLPIGGHAAETPGNIIALMAHDSALLAGQGYSDVGPHTSNILWVEDLDGMQSDPREVVTQVPIVVEDPAFTFLRMQVTSYAHLPITYTRDILFYKNGFMLVKDRAKFHASMKVRLGPSFHTRNLGPQCGTQWFNTYYDYLYSTGLGLGNGVQAVRNPAWDLLVYFTPRPTYTQAVTDRFKENPAQCSPIQLRQIWSGLTTQGQELTFTSILLPHAPVANVQSWLDPPGDTKEPRRIEIIRDDDKLTVVKIIGEMDNVNKLRRETWVMLNETGTLAVAGPLESDALLAVVGYQPNGTIEHRAIAGGTLLRFKGVDESANARKLPLASLVQPAEYGGKP